MNTGKHHRKQKIWLRHNLATKWLQLSRFLNHSNNVWVEKEDNRPCLSWIDKKNPQLKLHKNSTHTRLYPQYNTVTTKKELVETLLHRAKNIFSRTENKIGILDSKYKHGTLERTFGEHEKKQAYSIRTIFKLLPFRILCPITSRIGSGNCTRM